MNLALDLDGTLTSCEPRQSAVLQAALVRCGARVDLHRVWELKRDGASTEDALAQIGLEPEVARRAAVDWRRMIEEPFWLGMDLVLPGALDVLCLMREAGADLWLITARSRPEWVKLQLVQLGLSSRLDHITVVPTHDVANAKSTALRKMAAVAFFGDTESDWRASLEAEVPFYALASGQRSATFLRRSGIKHAFSDLTEAWFAFTK
jgi:phosphoglycolate phosphatase-like HAD superfamily hydrolase